MMQKQEYVEKYKDIAVRQMWEYDIPASITLAQGVLESQHGNSPLAVFANNHFGIKCKKDWAGEHYYMDDDAPKECFRKYDDVEDSFEDHSKFLKFRTYYKALFDLKRTDYKAWAKGLKKAGYATNPAYAELLIGIVEDLNLTQYDIMQFEVSNSILPKPVFVVHEKKNILEQRVIYFCNGAQYVEVGEKDNIKTIAHEFNTSESDLISFNDLKSDCMLSKGQRIYLQSKQNKALVENHPVSKGETMHSISQLYGIRLSQLYKYNSMSAGEEPKPGDVIYLNRKRRF